MTALENLDEAFEALRRQALALGRELPDRAGTVQAALGDLVLTIAWDTSHPTAPQTAAPKSVDEPARPLVATAPTETKTYITAHTVGAFYAAPEPGSAPFVEVGDFVTAGRQVGIVEAMKLMIPLECETSGRIVECLVENGASVEFGQPLFTIEPGAQAQEAA